jgi:hypothetical protein
LRDLYAIHGGPTGGPPDPYTEGDNMLDPTLLAKLQEAERLLRDVADAIDGQYPEPNVRDLAGQVYDLYECHECGTARPFLGAPCLPCRRRGDA